jgi:hypothetical protein
LPKDAKARRLVFRVQVAFALVAASLLFAISIDQDVRQWWWASRALHGGVTLVALAALAVVAWNVWAFL